MRITQPDAQPPLTREEAGKLGKCCARYIDYAKMIIERGTDDENESVRVNKVPITTVYKQLKRRLSETPTPSWASSSMTVEITLCKDRL
jgi:hypothetical protein